MNLKDLQARYQPIILPNGRVIEKKCSHTIIDSRKKLKFLPDFKGKSVLDIGCAEGFFLREAYRQGAVKVKGVELDARRAEVCNYVNGLWGYDIEIEQGEFADLKEQFDIVLCLSVLHHYQADFDTWRMVSTPRIEEEMETTEHLKFVQKIADLTKEMTVFEYAYNWINSKRKDTDFTLIAKIWEEHTPYNRVDFIGLSQKSRIKDRAIYYAYK